MAALETPLGDVALSFATGSVSVGGAGSDTYDVAPGTRLLAWDTPAFRAELVLTAPPPAALRGPAVAGAALGLWRVRAAAPLSECVFEARWSAGEPPGDGGPATGQFFAAATWWAGETEVTLGAPDAEGLNEYENLGIVLPRTWRALLHEGDPTMVVVEEFLSDGLRVRLPALVPAEVAHMHFAVAWSDAAADDSASWFGADPSLRDVFDGLPRAAV